MYLLIFLLLLPHAVPHVKFTGQIPEEPYAELPRKITEEENEMLKANCGAHFLGKSRMIGKSMPGHEVPRNRYPWIASLNLRGAERWYSCTAVQISSRHILTAAHCVVDFKPKEEYDKICSEVERLMIEEHHLNNRAALKELARHAYDVVSPKRLTIRASSSCKHLQQCDNDRIGFTTTKPPHVHENFNPCIDQNDLAIIELDRNIPSDIGTPICMIEADDRLERKLIAIGYGRDPISYHNMDKPDVLQEIHIDSGNVIESNSSLEAILFEKTLCPGDSGGPLVQINRDSRFSVVGIASAAAHRCNVTFAEKHKRTNTFMNVRSYVEWICTSTGICPIKKRGACADYTAPPSECPLPFEFCLH